MIAACFDQVSCWSLSFSKAGCSGKKKKRKKKKKKKTKKKKKKKRSLSCKSSPSGQAAILFCAVTEDLALKTG